MNQNSRLRHMRLTEKILLSNLVLFALPCLFLVLRTLSYIQTDAAKELNQSRLTILTQIDNNLETMFDNIVTYSDFFFSNSEVNSLIARKEFEDSYNILTVENTMNNYFRTRWIYYGNSGCYLEILGENGFQYSSLFSQDNVPYSELEALKEEDWYSMLGESTRIRYIPTYISEAFSADSDSAVRAVRLLRHLNSGRIIGLMNVSIQQEQLISLFEEGISDGTQTVFLMDENGKIISSTDTALTGKSVASESYLEKLLQYDSGYFPATVDGVYSQILFVTNQTTGWKIVMYETMPHGSWRSEDRYLRFLGIAVICALLAVMMSLYNSRFLCRPIRRLKDDMQAARDGDLSVRAQVESLDEFGQLSLQFNQMLTQIQELISQLSRKEEEKRTMELRALQAQINPHFLYNTLSSIRFQIDLDQKEEAQTSLIALAGLLKRTYSDYRELIPVREELEAVNNYLILMQNRYQGVFTWQIQAEEDAKDCLVPRICIQPLVENAILHGFEDIQAQGRIGISVRMTDGMLLICVSDNGSGADPDEIRRLLDSGQAQQAGQVSNIGINNVQERIRLFFGSGYGLNPAPAEGGGLIMQMRMPVIKEKIPDEYRSD